jgi:LmbE family N-acetylglucosaminyl deacetylase
MKSQAKNSGDRRMLISLAHPDDESFGMGGAIAYYAASGVKITLICSTNGDVGTVDDEHLRGYESISALRLDELHCAADALGIRDVVTFGYRDSGMMGTPENQHPDCLVQADPDVVTGRIVREIRRVRPQVIVTFDPYGGYGHPDHIRMYETTTRAFNEAGDPTKYPEQVAEGLEPYQPAKLYYSTFPRLALRISLLLIRLRGGDPRHMGKNKDLDLQAALDKQLPTHARINVGSFQPAWDAAAGCHASQQNPRETGSLFDRLRRIIFRNQDFTRVVPPPRPGEPIEHDLFAGVD